MNSQKDISPFFPGNKKTKSCEKKKKSVECQRQENCCTKSSKEKTATPINFSRFRKSGKKFLSNWLLCCSCCCGSGEGSGGGGKGHFRSHQRRFPFEMKRRGNFSFFCTEIFLGKQVMERSQQGFFPRNSKFAFPSFFHFFSDGLAPIFPSGGGGGRDS